MSAARAQVNCARRGLQIFLPRREEVKRMTFSEWMEFARANWRREEGQTMAEYGVVLAVITIGAVAVFTALSGGISGALNRVIAFLPK
jgi:Flp pilus assembly pilin Flp